MLVVFSMAAHRSAMDPRIQGDALGSGAATLTTCRLLGFVIAAFRSFLFGPFVGQELAL
jgi:hypothetical protein